MIDHRKTASVPGAVTIIPVIHAAEVDELLETQVAMLAQAAQEGMNVRGRHLDGKFVQTLDATRDLLEACRRAGHAPRFVFTSSIAVYGGELPDPVTDATPPSPRISYGAQKLVCEVLINDYTRRGYVDGRALRLPTVMVRPGTANTAVSGWASAIVREPLAGRDYVCPVRADTRMACLSLGRAIEALLHAAEVEPGALGFERSLLLTGIPVAAREMWAAVRRSSGGRSLGRVLFRPVETLQRIMDTVPRATRSERAAVLGFRPSASIDEIVQEHLQSIGTSGLRN